MTTADGSLLRPSGGTGIPRRHANPERQAMVQSCAAESETTLDNPAWWALTGVDRHLSERKGKARRYKPAVSPLAAVSDEYDPQAWTDMAELAAGSPVAVVTSSIPDGWAELHALPVIQMVYTEAPDGRLPSMYEFTPLVYADVPDMLALAEETEPGPFARSTIDLGGYRGWRVDGELVCMAGERMHPGNWTEISAVCTAPEHQGRGLAASIVGSLVNDIRAGGRHPFLNVTVENVRARRLYEKLGFKERMQMTVRVVQPSGTATSR
jgi:GNAT superfamily N-acetyltransferase